VDSSGGLLNHIVYDSYGQVVSQSNPSVDVRYGYTGRDLDPESGLNYYRARYYDAATGRFISEDPIGFGGDDANLYRYVLNSPIKLTDPFGLDSVSNPIGGTPGLDIALGIGAGLAAADEYRRNQLGDVMDLVQSSTAPPPLETARGGLAENIGRQIPTAESAMPTVDFDEPSAPRDTAHEPLSDEVLRELSSNAAREFEQRCQEMLEQLRREASGPYIIRTGSGDEFNPNGGGFDLGDAPSLRDLILTVDNNQGSNGARRQVMREQGIPTSQTPSSQSINESGREYQYQVPKAGGGTEIISVQQQTLDRSHPGQGHWEAGRVKLDDAGNPRMNRYNRPQLRNSKSKVDYND
jgi:RHS repeat-associated protein